ncbi:MAG: potassium transporter TrkG [Phycisphaeraceae bacterium]
MTALGDFNARYGRLPEPPRLRPVVLGLRLLLMALAAAAVALEHGFHEPRLTVLILRGAEALLLAAYTTDVLLRRKFKREPLPGAGVNALDYGLFVIGGLGLVGFALGFEQAWRFVEFAAVAFFCAELWRSNMAMSSALARPGLLLPVSFFLLVAVGTLLLMMPVATPFDQPIGWIDALFTATSAVCVTGLTVRDTATGFTAFGHTVIAILIQLGALGIIIFGSVLALMFGHGLSLRDNVSLSEMLHDQPMNQITRFVRFIVLVTLGIELLTAAALYPLWHGDMSMSQRTTMSLFHAVSAFCNAGFDLTGESLIGYRYAPLTHLVIMPIIGIGAIGFPVIENVWRTFKSRVRTWWRRKDRQEVSLRTAHLNLHTRIVLVTAMSLWIFGIIGITAGELVAGGQPHSFGHTLLDSVFLAQASRTAGFTTVAMDELSDTSIFTLIVLMLIGGSPGSPAGGMKTTVLALLLLSVFATLRNRPETEGFRRTLSDALVRRAATIAVCYVALAVGAILLLSLTEAGRFPLQAIVFDTVSAVGTVGLAFGVPGDASDAGKAILSGTMFLGRVGPLPALGALMLAGRRRQAYRYAHEDVVLG